MQLGRCFQHLLGGARWFEACFFEQIGTIGEDLRVRLDRNAELLAVVIAADDDRGDRFESK